MKNKERTLSEIIKRFFEPIFEHKLISLKAIIPAVTTSSLSIISLYIIKDITNLLEGGLNANVIKLLSVLIILILINYLIMIFTRNWTYGIVWPVFRGYMYKNNINNYIRLDNKEVEKIGTGKLIATIDKGIHTWVELIDIFFSQVLPNIIVIILSLVFISFINIYYALIISIILIFVFIVTSFVQVKVKVYRRLRKKSNIGVTRKFINILMNKFEILQNNKGIIESQNIIERLKVNIQLNRKIRNSQIYVEMLIRFLIDGIRITVILLYGIGYGTGVINFGEFVSLMSVTYILDQIFSNSINLYIIYTKLFVEIEKLWDFFDNTKEIKGYDTGNDFKFKKGEIRIEKLSYSYVKGKKIFNDFTLNIEGEKVIAFVGNSGGGKTTLAKLISGYIRADKGNIIVDSQKLNKVSLKTYYREIGYLTQDPSVFDGTILDNLTYSIDRELEKGEIKKIIKLAKCEFIYELQNGINTEIGERGVKLSGGQKQRLAIAKIFLKNPKIIILDEPTSALDSFSEEKIGKAMQNLFKKRTVIIIAHRLQTVKHADRIIVLENGKIIEDGNHKLLMKNKGHYSKMLKLQSGF